MGLNIRRMLRVRASSRAPTGPHVVQPAPCSAASHPSLVHPRSAQASEQQAKGAHHQQQVSGSAWYAWREEDAACQGQPLPAQPHSVPQGMRPGRRQLLVATAASAAAALAAPGSGFAQAAGLEGAQATAGGSICQPRLSGPLAAAFTRSVYDAVQSLGVSHD